YPLVTGVQTCALPILHVQNENREQSEREQSGPPRIKLDSRLLFYPLPTSEQGYYYGNAKKRLGQGGVGRGNRWRKIEQDRKPAEIGKRRVGKEGRRRG